jgi:uncharacterized protein
LSEISSDVVIRDDVESHRYVAEIDGARVGMAVYHLRGGRHFFVHTEVDSEHEGQGIGTRLVREALDDVRNKGGLVVPICPLFAAYIESHQEYETLVDRAIMDRLDSKAGSA